MVKLSTHVPTKNFKKFFWMEIHKIALYDHREGVVQSGAGGAPDTLLFLRKLPHGSKQPVLYSLSLQDPFPCLCIICAILLWKSL